MNDKRVPEDQPKDWQADLSDDPLMHLINAKLDEVYAAGPGEADISQAQSRLDEALKAIMPETVFYDQLKDTPVGDMWIAVREGKVVAVEYGHTESEFIEYLLKLTHGRPTRSGEQVAEAKAQVQDYLQGKITTFGIPFDISTQTEFQRRVLQATLKVPRGQVATYLEIAKTIGKPKASRAVGQALRRNPIPIVIPCHRVIASDGTLGGYSGVMGDKRKIKLLKLEGVMLA
jgi:methylated-DNA-[protein]-cysteine S-methyltransferase